MNITKTTVAILLLALAVGCGKKQAEIKGSTNVIYDEESPWADPVADKQTILELQKLLPQKVIPPIEPTNQPTVSDLDGELKRIKAEGYKLLHYPHLNGQWVVLHPVYEPAWGPTNASELHELLLEVQKMHQMMMRYESNTAGAIK